VNAVISTPFGRSGASRASLRGRQRIVQRSGRTAVYEETYESWEVRSGGTDRPARRRKSRATRAARSFEEIQARLEESTASSTPSSPTRSYRPATRAMRPATTLRMQPRARINHAWTRLLRDCARSPRREHARGYAANARGSYRPKKPGGEAPKDRRRHRKSPEVGYRVVEERHQAIRSRAKPPLLTYRRRPYWKRRQQTT
jgi:hypothetical protein